MYGASVSTSNLSSGTFLETSRTSLAVLYVTKPEGWGEYRVGNKIGSFVYLLAVVFSYYLLSRDP